MTKRFLFIFPFIFGFISGFAQLTKANSFFENYEYIKAAQFYKKVVKKDSSIFALQRLGDCYRLLKDYHQAELVYSRAIKRKGVDPIYFFYYGQALKNNGKLTEAKEQFAEYGKLVPTDKKTVVSLKSCDDIKIWLSQASHYEIANVRKLNTNYSEFSPILYQNKILFTAERTSDLVNFENNPINNRPLLKVYYSTISETDGNVRYSSPRLFPGPVNSDYHDGPLSIDKKNTIYFTRVSNYAKGAGFVNRPKILIAEPVKGSKSDQNWEKPVEFPYDNDTYVVEHPSVSPDGNVLYFASDMPGGYGGNDIWMSRKNGTHWEKPENLGPEINTSGNEAFPMVRGDGMLFFSSDGLPGFGGLDLFSAKFENGKWTSVSNLGLTLNSSTDDFGIVFSDDFRKGYFSSDRAGGLGADDLYSFVLRNKAVDVSGRILLSPELNDPAKNVKLVLMTNDGSVINFTTSDSIGFFKFENLSPDQKYIVKMDENDPVLKFKDKFYMADNQNKIIRVTVINEKGDRFVFQSLPSDPSALPMLDEYSSNLKALSGSIRFGENEQALANARLNLTNEAGEVLKTTITNSGGGFVFSGLASDKNLLIKLEENSYLLPPKTKITFRNSSGEVIETFYTSEKGFDFVLLPSDQIKLQLKPDEEVQLKMSMSGKLLSGAEPGSALANAKINLVNDKGEIIQSVYTDKNGDFKFTQLPSDRNFLLKIADDNPQLVKLKEIRITDAKGKEMGTMEKKGGTFEYQYLTSDKSSMPLLGVDDSQLKFKMKGQLVDGDGNSRGLVNAKVNLLNEKGEVVQTGYTDAQGNFSFEQLPADRNYFISIDDKDPQLATIKRLVLKDEAGKILKDIPANQNKGFRFQFLAADVNDLALMKVEEPLLAIDLHGKLELKDGSNTLLANKKVSLVNERGEVLDSAITDSNGGFEFKNLPSDRKYIVKLAEEDVAFSEKVKLILTDTKGKEVQELQNADDGSFQYSLLSSEKKTFSLSGEADGGVRLNLNGQLFYRDSLKKEVLSLSKVSVYDDKGVLLQSGFTDKSGRFTFLGLPADKHFLLRMDEGDYRLVKSKSLIIADKDGNTVEEFKRNIKNFGYILLPSDMNALATEVVDDSFNSFKLLGKKLLADAQRETKPQTRNLTAKIDEQVISGTFKIIYFDLDQSALSQGARQILKIVADFAAGNPGTILEIDGHTDSRGGDKYNLYLSDHRMQEVKNYLVWKGVDVNRLKGVAYGKRRPVNSCIEHVECSEAEHAQNRRVEIKVIKR